ncbi:MAG: nucleotidyltransferase family protein [Chthoniobacteraceae bacterium]
MAGDYPSALWPEGIHRSLLRAALTDGPAAAMAFHEWSDGIVFDDLDTASFYLLPLLRWNLNRLGVKYPSMPRLDSVCRFLLVETTMKLDVLRKLLLALREMDVPALLLKGSAIGQRYYPHPSLRPMADCDVLIPYGQRLRIVGRLLEAGWRIWGDHLTPHHHHGCDFWFPPFNTISVEVHWRSNAQATRREDRMAWKAAEPLVFRDIPCKAFCVEDEIINTCRHGFNWNAGSPPMRWLADCAMIVRGAGARINWHLLAERARQWEETLCVRHSLEWIRREAGIPVPPEAFAKLRAQRVRRRELRIYILKARPAKDWDSVTLLLAEFLNRETPWWLWPLRPRRVLRYFASQFLLPDHADVLRYFVYHFWRLARLRSKPRLEAGLLKLALAMGSRGLSATLVDPGFTGSLDAPCILCWARCKVRLEGFVFAHDGSSTPQLRVICDGSQLPFTCSQMARPDIARIHPAQPNALKSGFSIVVDLPPGDSRLLIERRGSDGWEPIFAVRIYDIELLNGSPWPKNYPVPSCRLDFSNARANEFLLSGWSDPEPSGRWSDGHKAGMIFGLEEVETLDLDIKMHPFLVAGQWSSQGLIISLNGQLLCIRNLTRFDPAVYTVKLPQQFLLKNNVLVFELPQAASPAALNAGLDSRALGIHVEWMEFRAEKALPDQPG